MNNKRFVLNGREEVEAFNERLRDYMSQYTTSPFDCPNILTAFDYCMTLGKEGGRLFAAILDLKLTASMLFEDTNTVGVSINRQSRILESDVLENQDYFDSKFRLLHANIDMIVRCRAIYDKFMGVIVLMTCPEKYDIFLGEDSRKSAFKKYMSNTLSEAFLKDLETEIRGIDESYRTAEVHQAGSMRTWVFLDEAPFNEKQIGIVACWNRLSGRLDWLDKQIESALKKQVIVTTEKKTK